MTSNRPARGSGWVVATLLVVLFWTRPFWFEGAAPSSVVSDVANPEPELLWVHYHERPPYYTRLSNDVGGLCVEPVRQALELAGLRHRWCETPPLRQLRWLQVRTGEAHAAVGWFRTPDRERWARFSLPIYRDGPWVAMVRRAETRVGAVALTEELLSVPGLRVLTRAGYHYGSWLEGLWDRMAPVRESSPGSMVTLLRCVALGRADCVFLAREEAEVLLQQESGLETALRIVTLADAPVGPERHVLFGPGVPEGWMERFNKALWQIRSRPAFPGKEMAPVTGLPDPGP